MIKTYEGVSGLIFLRQRAQTGDMAQLFICHLENAEAVVAFTLADSNR